MMFSLLVSLFLSLPSTLITGFGSSDELRCDKTREALEDATAAEMTEFYQETCGKLGELKEYLSGGPERMPFHFTFNTALDHDGVQSRCLPFCDDVGFEIPCAFSAGIERRLGGVNAEDLYRVVRAADRMHCDSKLGLTAEWQSQVMHRWRTYYSEALIRNLQELLETVQQHKLLKFKEYVKAAAVNDPSCFRCDKNSYVSEVRTFPSIMADDELQALESYNQIDTRFMQLFGIGVEIIPYRYELLVAEIRHAYVKDIEWRIHHLQYATEHETPEDYVQAAIWISPGADMTIAQMYTREVYGRTALKLLRELRSGELTESAAREIADKVRFYARWYNFTLADVETDEAELSALPMKSPFSGEPTVYRW